MKTRILFGLSTIGSAVAFISNPNAHLSARTTPAAANIPQPLWASTLEDVDKKTSETPDDDGNKPMSFGDRMASSGMASAAAVATAAVNAAVSMKSLEAPDVAKSYVALDKTQQELDEEGLPIVYDKDLIEQYWSKERGALNQRWGYFVGKAVPFLTRMTTLFIRDGKIADKEIPELSRQARVDLQDLGPTFIKAGQMMSVRPDVLPPPALEELTKLQDSVVPFDTKVAVEQIEKELGGPLGQFFTSISEEPVAAASLAQVYLATLNDGKDTKVAVKVQRPSVLGTVSKDLYVLRRAAEVFQGLVDRFAPQQRTNYVALLNEWAIGFYTELDFNNEARNQQTLRDMMLEKKIKGIFVPKVYHELCTRRLLVSEWVDGKKLSEASTEDVARVTPFAQEAFLTQLLEVGFFHGDPHPGNLLLLNEATEEGYELALIDCGLMASINTVDRDNMISAVIHLANKDYTSLVDDFVKLQILPEDCNRPAIIPLMDKALSPYVKGGGAKKYEEELKKLYGMEDDDMQSTVGGFQAMTQDALTVLNDIPFSIPPYFAILGRAIVTLEGIALTGNPDYGIIMESYPFIARKLLREDRPEIQSALQEVLYSGEEGDSGLKLTRLLALLNNAAGAVATKDGAAFVDLDAVPEDGLGFKEGLKFVLSDDSESLRNLLEPEVDSIVDILTRQIFRMAINDAVVALTPPRLPALPFLDDILPPAPKLDEIPLPLLLPGSAGLRNPSLSVLTIKELTDAVAPKLSQADEIFALGLADAATEFFGPEVGAFFKGESVFSAKTAELVIATLRSGAIGETDALSPEAVNSVIEVVSNTLSRVRGADSGTSGIEKELTEAVENLDENESARLKDIVTQITERSIARSIERLSVVDRVLGA
ncbi:MAG: hypothetical protein SGBAC_000946 [Bacillariaceae sp.]